MAWQTLRPEQLHQLGITPEQARASAWWVDERGRPFGAERAVAEALRACPAPWRWLGTLLLAPPGAWLGQLVYPLVARFRHRLPGGTPACRL